MCADNRGASFWGEMDMEKFWKLGKKVEKEGARGSKRASSMTYNEHGWGKFLLKHSQQQRKARRTDSNPTIIYLYLCHIILMIFTL